ncbi:MAG: hypothetical protein H0U87_00715 [Acidobacteria bacterium]|nr:hypothetical protein [Acidobacteriota bacterium]
MFDDTDLRGQPAFTRRLLFRQIVAVPSTNHHAALFAALVARFYPYL